MFEIMITESEMKKLLNLAEGIRVSGEVIIEANETENVSKHQNQERIKFVRVWKKIKKLLLNITKSTRRENEIYLNIEELFQDIDLLKNEAQDSYEKFVFEMKQRIDILKRSIFEKTVMSFPKKLSDGDCHFEASNCSVSLQMKANGDLKISLKELFGFLLEGQLTVNMHYDKIAQ